MFRILTVIFLGCCFSFSFAQGDNSKQETALLKEIETCADNSCRANLYQRLAKLYVKEKNYDKMLFYFDKELSIRNQMADSKELAIEKSKTYFNVISLLKQFGNYESAEKLADEALLYNKKNIGSESPETAETYKQIAQIAFLMKKPDRVKWALNLALSIRKKEKIPDALKIIELLILQSGLFDEMGDLEMSESILKEALSLYEKSKLKDEELKSRLYISLGGIAGYRGRYAEAISFTNRSLEIRLKSSRNPTGLANCYSNLGVFYHNLKQYEEAVNQLNESLKILRELSGENNPSTIESKLNLAGTFIELNQFDKAKKLLQEILSARRKETYYFALWQLAEVEMKLENNSKAEYYFKLTEKELQGIYNSNHPKLIDFYLDFGTFYKNINELQKAKANFEKCISLNRVSDRISDPLIYLTAATELLEISEKIDYDIVNKSIDLIGDIWKNCRRDADYNLVVGQYKKFYEALLYNIYRNSNQGKLPEKLLLNCFESVKSLQLFSALDETEQLKRAKVPERLIDQLKNLKNSTIYYEQQWLSAEFDEDKSLALKLRKKFEESENQFSKLRAEIEDKYDFFANPFNNADFSGLRNKIADNELVLHYFIGEKSSFMLAFNSKKMMFKKIDSHIIDKLDGYTHKIQSVDELEQDHKKSAIELCKSSNEISMALLPDNNYFSGISKITVIPDATLFYIPFEVLFYENSDLKNLSFSGLPYLIKKYSIRYAYSLQVLDKQKNPKKGLLMSAVAPFYSLENEDLQGLENDSELDNLQKIYLGGFYRNKKISKADLLKILAKRPDILHLAMHASAPDSSDAYFILSNAEMLSVHEISKFNLDNTAMIVLSACETGLGTQTKGEGLMSLGRAFAYSGAASVVNTLWPLHDHSAVELMKLFYQNLDKGMTKSEALRMAKLSYLKEAGDMQAHPLFWAAPVLWGNDEPIQIKKRNELYLWSVPIASFLILSVFSLILYRRFKRNKISQDVAA